MEQKRDDIAEGDQSSAEFLKKFFDPFQKLVESKTKEIQKSDVMKERVIGVDPGSGLEVLARLGRFGPYVQLGRMPKPDPEAKKKKVKDKVKLKSASIPKHIPIDQVTLEQALSLLSFPRELGLHEGEMVTVNLGRFGPYCKWGTTSAAVPKDSDPGLINFDQAVKLLTETKENKKKAAEPLRTLGEDPNTKGTIHVKTGRFGPYVTDGKMNASLGKKFAPEKPSGVSGSYW